MPSQSPLQIFVNCRFLTQEITGVQRYAIEICKELSSIEPNITFLSPHETHYKTKETGFNICKFGFFTGHLWEQIELPLFLLKKNNYILINLSNTAPIFLKKNIIVLHDISFTKKLVTHSPLFRLLYKTIIPILLKRSKKIFTVSEESKREIKSYYNIQNEISVAPNACSNFFGRGKFHNKNPKEKYFLSVAPFAAHKNFGNLYKGFLKANNGDYKLVVVGKLEKTFKPSTEKINSNFIKFMGRVSDKELNQLYQHATGLIFPSFFEGFGIPIIEAQKCGCPVIASDIAIFQEVGGESILYCDPYNSDDIAKKIKIFMENPQVSKELSNLGLLNSGRYSWKTSAQKILEKSKG